MPDWVTQGFNEYSKRLPHNFHLELSEVPLVKRGKNADIARIIQTEGNQIIAKIPNASFVVALDEKGKQWTTTELAKNLQKWNENYQNISLLVGGPDGLADECFKAANTTWSLSNLTLPHPLVRIVIAEQIYRAWTVLQNHPYHRA